jgi:hypothetical protein
VTLRIEHHLLSVPIVTAPIRGLGFPAGGDGLEHGKDEVAKQQKQEKAEQ